MYREYQAEQKECSYCSGRAEAVGEEGGFSCLEYHSVCFTTAAFVLCCTKNGGKKERWEE